MKKKHIIFLLLIAISLVSVSLYTTLAYDTKVTTSDTTITFDLTADAADKQVIIPAGSTKYIDYTITNNNQGTIQYELIYEMVSPTSKPDDLGVYKVTSNTQGTIAKSATITMQIKIVNNYSSSVTIRLKTVLGYEYGGDLIFTASQYHIMEPEPEPEPVPPNAPSIASSYMIPVVYNGVNWVKANQNNTTFTSNSKTLKWYDYDNKEWANMVLVSSTNRTTYASTSTSAGTVINNSDILAFYVWIPRYKYKVWNINKIPQDDQAYTYNAYNDGIDIQWESGTNSTGNVSCTYYYTDPVEDAGSPNETCTVTGDTSNPYYTHPAFTFGNDELTGIWVGKFETSSNTHLTGSSYGGGDVTSLTARIVPNVTSWRKIKVGNIFTVLQNMHNASNEYGLPTTKTSVDSHLMKNTEWGAVAYLTNSIYGKCTGLPGGCTEVQINGHWDNSDGGAYYYTYLTTKTGCGPSADGANGSYDTACTEYNTTTGMLASTTGNITGVYDMSGGANEYVMGNMSSATGVYTFYPSSAGSAMPVSWYTATTSKYVDTYAKGSNSSGQIAYNRSRLGDATGEVNITGSYDGGGWYSDHANFVLSSYPWFYRGGAFYDGTIAGPFFFDYYGGGAYSNYSFRASLVPLGAA